MNWNDDKMAYIYMLLNVVDGIAYVGQTTRSPEERAAEHFKIPPTDDFREDLEFYGKEQFELKVLDVCFYRHRYIVETWWTNKMGREYVLYNNHSGQSPINRDGLNVGKHNPMYGKNGANCINGRKFIAKDSKGNVVKEFPSVQEAKKFCNVKGHTQLYQAVKLGIKYKGYYWETGKRGK